MKSEKSVDQLVDSDQEKVQMTPREVDIVRVFSEGKNAREVAEQLEISINTVEAHRHNIIKKLSCKNMVQVVKLFCDEGLI